MAFLFLVFAAFAIRLMGIEHTSYIATLVLGALVLAGGTYGIIFLAALIVHVVQRVVKREPIMEIED